MSDRCPVCRNEGVNRTCHPIEDAVSRANLPDGDPRLSAAPSDPAAPLDVERLALALIACGWPTVAQPRYAAAIAREYAALATKEADGG